MRKTGKRTGLTREELLSRKARLRAIAEKRAERENKRIERVLGVIFYLVMSLSVGLIFGYIGLALLNGKLLHSYLKGNKRPITSLFDYLG